MTSLVACLLTGKGSWAEVTKLISSADWEHIYLITNSFGKENYKPTKPEKTTLSIINEESDTQTIITTLKPHFSTLFGEIALNLLSGSGKTHMAVLAALLQSGAGIRLVEPSEQGFKEL